MRACFVQLVGPSIWKDDDADEPYNNVCMYGEDGINKLFTFVGEFKTQNHTFRRYQEVLTGREQ